MGGRAQKIALLSICICLAAVICAAIAVKKRSDRLYVIFTIDTEDNRGHEVALHAHKPSDGSMDFFPRI